MKESSFSPLAQAVLSLFLTEMDAGESKAAQMATGAHRETCVIKSKEGHSLENEKYLKEQELESQSNTGNIHNGMFH